MIVRPGRIMDDRLGPKSAKTLSRKDRLFGNGQSVTVAATLKALAFLGILPAGLSPPRSFGSDGATTTSAER